MTLDEICAQLEISDSIKTNALRLLTEYKKRNSFLNDINNAQYLTMAIHQSCKLKNIKNNRTTTKLIHLSRLNVKVWKRLEEEWNNWMHEILSQNESDFNNHNSELKLKKIGK